MGTTTDDDLNKDLKLLNSENTIRSAVYKDSNSKPFETDLKLRESSQFQIHSGDQSTEFLDKKRLTLPAIEYRQEEDDMAN